MVLRQLRLEAGQVGQGGVRGGRRERIATPVPRHWLAMTEYNTEAGDAMQKEYRNIYFSARQTAGLTQERWAEMLGISVEAVRQYEGDRILPSDGVVARMAELSMLPPLGYWHLRHKSELAAAELPPVERLPLAQAVVQLLSAMRDFESLHRVDELLRIAADGRVDLAEEPGFKATVRDLHGIVQAALQIDYAERGDDTSSASLRSAPSPQGEGRDRRER